MTKREVIKGDAMTHTPGPWTLYPDDRTSDATIAGPDGWQVAVWCPPLHDCDQDSATRCTHHRRDTANARLIAAAPELLALVEQVAWHYEQSERDNASSIPHTIGQTARALLARIEGR